MKLYKKEEAKRTIWVEEWEDEWKTLEWRKETKENSLCPNQDLS